MAVASLGLSPARWDLTPQEFPLLWEFIEAAEALGYDSFWCSDPTLAPQPVFEPIALLGAAAARTHRIRLGTGVLALSLRNPVLTAKELATLDFLSGGRLIVGVGVGAANLAEYRAFGISPRDRGARVDEAIGLMRLLWSGEHVTATGRLYRTEGISMKPEPVQRPYPPIWIGGASPAALRRAAPLGDGWLGSSVTPSEVEVAVGSIQSAAQSAGRIINPGSYGVLLHFSITPQRHLGLLPRPRKDVPLESFCALGSIEQVGERIQEYLDAGAGTVVLRPVCAAKEALSQVEMVARELRPRLRS